jgi:anti-anti-sigma factor
VSAAPAGPHSWSTHIHAASAGGTITLAVAGRLGTAGAVELRDRVQATMVAGGRLRLDLAGVEYISSAGLAVLRETADQLHRAGGALEIAGTSEPVRFALRLAGPIPHVEQPPAEGR